MSHIDFVIEKKVAHVRLNRPKSNALNLEVIQELNALIQNIQQNPAVEGMILQGKDGFFSSGLDLMTLYNLDASEFKIFWNEFLLLVRSLVNFSKPSVAAITGHSPAGGCVLAICCDYRVMMDGDYIIGLNELPVGIVVPECIFHLYSFWIGKAVAYRSLLQGKLFNPQEAHKIGLVDEVVPASQIISSSEMAISHFMKFDPQSWQKSKLNLRNELIQTFNKDFESDLEAISKEWWKPSTRALLKSIIENLKHKSHGNK